jgi:preprotein translocase SecE subunit
VAEQTPQKQKRRLKPALTMRERAERTAAQSGRPKKLRRLTKPLAAPLHATGRGLGRAGRLPIWRPITVAGRFVGRIILPRYLRNSWRELRQVTWPNGRQTRALTGAVILFSVIFGLFIAAFDYGLDKLFKEVILK